MESRQSLLESESLAYKYLSDGTPVFLEIYPPTIIGDSPVPSILYFHGGGLVVGDRHSWQPTWLRSRANECGFAFISADYRLIPPATAHSILEDLKDLFEFLAKEDIYSAICLHRPTSQAEAYKFKLDMEAIIVAGTSAGGLCAYFAAMHCHFAKPKAVLSMYGGGGNFFSPLYLIPKDKPFIHGRELLDLKDFAEFLFPFPDSLTEIAGSPPEYHTADYHVPGYPANPRMLLTRLYFQLGVFLDYYTGSHSPSLSETLRPLISPNSDRVNEARDGRLFKDIVPKEHHGLFPQFQIGPDWPPTILCHGTADSLIPVEESRLLVGFLQEAKIDVKLFEIEGEDHAFDLEENAEKKHGDTFDKIFEILKNWVTG